MSFKQPYQQQGAVYRENLSFQQQIQKQMLAVMQAINEDQDRYITSAIKGFLLFVTPDIIKDDNLYITQIKNINDEWQKDLEQQQQDYDESVKGALCPDVEDEPEEEMPVKYMLDKYVVTQALFERKGLLLEPEVSEDL